MAIRCARGRRLGNKFCYEDGGVGGWLIRSARRIVGDLKELMLTA